MCFSMVVERGVCVCGGVTPSGVRRCRFCLAKAAGSDVLLPLWAWGGGRALTSPCLQLYLWPNHCFNPLGA